MGLPAGGDQRSSVLPRCSHKEGHGMGACRKTRAPQAMFGIVSQHKRALSAHAQDRNDTGTCVPTPATLMS